MQQKKSALQRILPHIIAIGCFLAITFTYFSPLLEGKVLPQSDVQQYKGMSHELSEYYKNEGESSAWTGSMFSGMPAYQIGVWGGAPNFLDYLEMPVKALGSSSAGAVFAGMLMAYILFCIMGVGVVPAMLGAIAYSLSSYNIIIIDAGHVTKAWCIAYMPLVVAGMVAAFKKKYLLSGLLMALGLALQIKNNHLQVTYYTGMLCAILYIGLLIDDIRNKNISSFFKSTAALVIGALIAVLCNLGNIYSNYEMSKESTRGQSELSKPTEGEKQSSGLDKDYAFAWSYGKTETLSLLVPDINGGASGGWLSPNSNLYKAIQANAPGAQLDAKGIQAQTYWGDQPFTSGPVYFGAVICFLFVLGMFIIKSPIKWLLFASTVFFIFLSWGSNFETFNDWFFYHFPMYNKFRAVSTALVVPALTVVMVAVWGLKEFLENDDNKKRLVSLYISVGITGGIAFLLWVAPSLFGLTFMTDSDQQWMSQVPDWYYNALIADRKDLLSGDAFRSLFFILLAAGALFAVIKLKGNNQQISFYASLALVILVLIDLWGVDKRYLNNDNFQSKLAYNSDQPFPLTAVDKEILQDKDPSYRVLNLNNPFNETKTSYYHKSIGGYHAAKLKRYQELIDSQLQSEINNIIKSFDSQNLDTIINSMKSNKALNMLNARYVIFHPEQAPLKNPYAMGNAWFVDSIKFVATPDQEIESLKTIDLRTIAVLNDKYEADFKGFKIHTDSTARISMIESKPNRLKYKSSSNTEGLVVMSEIFYNNGWEASVDRKEVPVYCADWTLRAIRVPAGEHEIEFKFIPHKYNTARTVASVTSAILLLVLIAGVIMFFIRKEDIDK